MKKSIIFILFVFISIQNYGQKLMKNGQVTFEITEVHADDEQTEQMLQMMKGSQTIYAFEGDKHFTHMSMMGGMADVKNYIDNSKKENNMLLDMMGRKIWVTTPVETPTDGLKNVKMEKIAGDNKKVLNYDCYAVKFLLGEVSIKAYLTNKLKADVKIIPGMEGFEWEGLPLQYEMNMGGGTKMTMTAIDLKETIDSALLKMNTDGYTKMTQEEFVKELGPMAGMLGK